MKSLLISANGTSVAVFDGEERVFFTLATGTDLRSSTLSSLQVGITVATQYIEECLAKGTDVERVTIEVTSEYVTRALRDPSTRPSAFAELHYAVQKLLENVPTKIVLVTNKKPRVSRVASKAEVTTKTKMESLSDLFAGGEFE